jgi:hypothetical protein
VSRKEKRRPWGIDFTSAWCAELAEGGQYVASRLGCLKVREGEEESYEGEGGCEQLVGVDMLGFSC